MKWSCLKWTVELFEQSLLDIDFLELFSDGLSYQSSPAFVIVMLTRILDGYLGETFPGLLRRFFVLPQLTSVTERAF